MKSVGHAALALVLSAVGVIFIPIPQARAVENAHLDRPQELVTKSLRRAHRAPRPNYINPSADAKACSENGAANCNRRGVPTCFDQPATLVGTNGDDVLVGTTGFDVIVGLGGDDVIKGLRKTDFLCGNTGADRIRSGGRGGRELLSGGGGHDVLIDGEGSAFLSGGPGGDVIRGGGNSAFADYSSAPRGVKASTVSGRAVGEGKDFLHDVSGLIGSNFDDDLTAAVVRAGDGDDKLVSASGDDQQSSSRLDGGAGDDSLIGGPGNDTLADGPGNDEVFGGSGPDFMFEIWTNSANPYPGPAFADDVYDGGSGVDAISYGQSVDVSVRVDLASGTATGDGNDQLKNIENASGSESAPDDELIGDDGDNLLHGGAIIRGAGGNDYLSGGISMYGDDGDDFLTASIPVGTSRYFFGGSGNDHLIGGVVADELAGEEGNDILEGIDGDDVLTGGPGDDRLDGGLGVNTSDGGEGTDTCVNPTADEGATNCEAVIVKLWQLADIERRWADKPRGKL
jgi:Ca2+-binding RTX toxin-like protein